MKIALVSYDFGEYCVNHANGLARHGKVLLVLPQSIVEPHLPFLDPRVELETFPKPRLRQAARQLQVARRIVKRVHSFDPDVVHFQHGHLWFNGALPWLRHYPLVVTIHDPTPHRGDRESRRTPKVVMKFGFRCAHRVIVHGRALRRVLVEELGFEGKRIDVIPHIAIGERDAARAVASTEANRVLFFGRIWEYKGLADLIRAEPLIRAQIPDVRVTIAGIGEDFGRYRELMENPEAFEVYNTFVSEELTRELFAKTSVVVLPYVEATQSGVIPMAYAFGKPVVATTVGALPEAVEDGRTGLLVPPRDPQALARAISQILGDPTLQAKLGANAAEKLRREWSADVIADQTAEVYEKVIEECGG